MKAKIQIFIKKKPPQSLKFINNKTSGFQINSTWSFREQNGDKRLGHSCETMLNTDCPLRKQYIATLLMKLIMSRMVGMIGRLREVIVTKRQDNYFSFRNCKTM